MGTYSIVSGLCLLLTVGLYVQTITKIARSEKRDMYAYIMVVGIIYIAMDVLWGVIYDDLIPIPVSLQKVIYAVFYASSGILAYRWFVFVEYMQDSIFHRKALLRWLFRIPVIFVVVVSFLSIWTESFFYIGQNGEYIRGDLYVPQLFMTYGYIIFSAVKVLFLMFVTRELEKQTNYMIILSYFMFPIVFGILQVTAPNAPYLCIGITLASVQHYLFSVKFEQEREISASKIHSLTRLFISSYYLELETGKWQHLSSKEEKASSYLTGEFYKRVPKKFESAVHMYADNYVHEDDRETYCRMCSQKYIMEHLNKENQFYFFDYRQVAGETEKWYRMHAIAVSYAPDGKVTHAVMAVMDVTRQIITDMQRQQVLEEALVQAQNANKAKSTFLSNMSHDIRTPMNAIIGFTNLAQTHIEKREMVDEYLGKIMSASKHLLSLINDILDMSRIESGKIQIEEDEISLTEIIKDMDNLIHPMALEKDIDFVINTNVVNSYIYCDKLRLNQVLINLLGNAVKFTPRGGKIFLSIEQKTKTDTVSDGYGKYAFKVKDTGIGIGEEFLAKIFQPFEREKVMDTSGVQGTGLGLSIAKSIVEMMDGKISVESELGKGTEFTVEVVFMLQDKEEELLSSEELESQKQLEEEAKRKEEKESFAGKKILLVDDNEINREIASAILTDAGFIVAEAMNGKEAVETIRDAAEDEFAVVLMDVQMPVMDGYQATKKIRSLPNHALANIPIVAMTADAFDEDKKKAIESGMNGHIAKPIDVPVLFATLKQITK